jgi:hypothetical protein
MLTIGVAIGEKQDETYYCDNQCQCPSTDRGYHQLMNETKQYVVMGIRSRPVDDTSRKGTSE